MIKKKIFIATGGTGGHIFPAYSLANFLIKTNYDVTIISDNRGFNYLKNFKSLNIKKIDSSPLVKQSIFKYLISIIAIITSILKSILFLLINRPTIIFGMGGYSSFPICIAAFVLRINFIIYENNMVIGKANKYLLPFTNKILVSYKELEGVPKNHSKKILEIGNLIREEIINSELNSEKVDNYEKLKILVLGGSQAAKVFAEKLPLVFQKLQDAGVSIKIIQQCQKQQINQLSEFYKNANIDFEAFSFTDKIIEYYSKTNLVITRSGASVLGELVNVKIPFIAIPLPTSADNHQHKNAEFYEKKGYGYLLEEKNIEKNLYELIMSFIKDKSLIKKIISNQRLYSNKDVYSNFKKKIEEIINEKN